MMMIIIVNIITTLNIKHNHNNDNDNNKIMIIIMAVVVIILLSLLLLLLIIILSLLFCGGPRCSSHLTADRFEVAQKSMRCLRAEVHTSACVYSEYPMYIHIYIYN